ncbi:hypothetical protein VTK26DRAFT_2412 [Humicola hyalothermophila]
MSPALRLVSSGHQNILRQTFLHNQLLLQPTSSLPSCIRRRENESAGSWKQVSMFSRKPYGPPLIQAPLLLVSSSGNGRSARKRKSRTWRSGQDRLNAGPGPTAIRHPATDLRTR